MSLQHAMRTASKWTRAAIFAIAALAVATSASVAETPADQLVIGTNIGNISTLDPGSVNGSISLTVIANIYDTLVEVEVGKAGSFLPALAESWAISEDGNTITFKLRPGVTFQSGNPVTAHDVAWSIQRTLILNKSPSTNWKLNGLTAENVAQHVRAIDDLTVEFKIPVETDPLIVLDLIAKPGGQSVVDSKVAQENQKDGDLGAAWLTTNSAGSGAFSLQNWQANDLVLLTANETYWKGKSALGRIIFRHMPESQTQRLTLEKGDIDMAANLSAPDAAALRGNEGIEFVSVSGGQSYYLAANQKHPALSKRDVRLALRYLIDYEGINNTIMPNYGVSNQRPIPAGRMGSLPDPGYTLNVELAKEYLAKAGHPDGFAVTLHTLSDPPFIEMATAIQGTLAQAGIKAEILSGSGSQTYGAMQERKFDLLVGRGFGNSMHPHIFLRSGVQNLDNSDEAKLVNSQGWRTSWYSPGINTLIDAALLETDPEEQKLRYEEIQMLYEALVPAMQPVSLAIDTVAMRSDVKGFVMDFDFATRYWGVSKDR
jgi:peptide/nickel transport system substrate-binding protein